MIRNFSFSSNRIGSRLSGLFFFLLSLKGPAHQLYRLQTVLEPTGQDKLQKQVIMSTTNKCTKSIVQFVDVMADGCLINVSEHQQNISGCSCQFNELVHDFLSRNSSIRDHSRKFSNSKKPDL